MTNPNLRRRRAPPRHLNPAGRPSRACLHAPRARAGPGEALRKPEAPADCTALSKVAYVLRSFFQSLCLIKLDAAGGRRRAFGLRASSLARRRRSFGRSTSGKGSRIEQERPRSTRFRSVSWKAEAL